MSLILDGIAHSVDGVTYLEALDLELAPGSFNVLLGRTLAGKTTLLRIMAGLETPTRGQVLMHGENVTRKSVRKRNVSMVYQQFINYPGLTVFDNIASPLKLARVPQEDIRRRVHETASMLHIEHLLKRYPAVLSGGQQQRTALGRALVKDADLVLFDEPLVNLDYKLREEFREELRELFKARNCIAVYATTEPNEALALGGHTAVLHAGRLLQYGPTAEVYHRPRDVLTAEMFSEPPINVLPAMVSGAEVSFDHRVSFPLQHELAKLAPGQYQFGVRASHITLRRQAEDDMELEVTVDIAEISGSETFLHVHNDHFHLVLHLTGVHEFVVDQRIKVYLPSHKMFAFDRHGAAVHIPARPGVH